MNVKQRITIKTDLFVRWTYEHLIGNAPTHLIWCKNKADVPVRLPNGGDSVATDEGHPRLNTGGTATVKFKTDHTVLLLSRCEHIGWVKF